MQYTAFILIYCLLLQELKEKPNKLRDVCVQNGKSQLTQLLCNASV